MARTQFQQYPRRVGSGVTEASSGAAQRSWRNIAARLFLACGAASGALYVALDAIAALRYDGYSYKSQTISELSAVGAPTRSMWLVVGALYALLFLGFAIGVWVAAGRSRALRLAGALLVAFALVGLFAWPLAPMHPREILAAGGGTWQDTMHLVLGGVDSVLMIAIIALAAWRAGRRFQFYSVATVVVMLVFGALMSSQSGKIADNEATPWIGIEERIMLYSVWAWFAVLGLRLLWTERRENRA
jgi:hypothetical protein